jgi:hypothetical protein
MLLWGLRPDGATDAPVPRLDGPYAAIDAYVAALPGGGPAGLREQLVHWMRFGFCVLRGAFEPELVDELLADVDAVFERRAGDDALITVEGVPGARRAADHTDESLRHPHLRVQDSDSRKSLANASRRCRSP